MKFLMTTIASLFLFTQAEANPAFVSEKGYISLSGLVERVTNDEFSITVNDESVDVEMDQINDDTIDYLTDSGIVKEGSYVTVYGHIADDIGGSQIIKAKNIRLYAN